MAAHADTRQSTERQSADTTRDSLPSETPPAFKARTESFDYVKREEMIPMHDGVKLKTFILIPKGASKAPMLLDLGLHTTLSERTYCASTAHTWPAVVPADG